MHNFIILSTTFYSYVPHKYLALIFELGPGPPQLIKVVPSAFDKNTIILSWLEPLSVNSLPTKPKGVEAGSILEHHEAMNSISSYILYKR